MRDHGGDLDRARAQYGGLDWVDLSTGINAVPYPVPELSAASWGRLPERPDLTALEHVAARAYRAAPEWECVALAGAQAAIQLVPHLARPGTARVLTPTYNEHAGALRALGWTVQEVDQPKHLIGADLAVVVNPNNPDGRRHGPKTLVQLSTQVGVLVVDESFADPDPDLSVLPLADAAQRIVVLRSFGKFYGLAGVRLGFAFAASGRASRVRAMAGPWCVSGPALACGQAGLADAAWHAATTARLVAEAARLDALAQAAGWGVVGGTALFRTYETGNAAKAQDRLARAHIWSRIFPYSQGWLRLGLPGSMAHWHRLETALTGQPQ